LDLIFALILFGGCGFCIEENYQAGREKKYEIICSFKSISCWLWFDDCFFLTNTLKISFSAGSSQEAPKKNILVLYKIMPLRVWNNFNLFFVAQTG